MAIYCRWRNYYDVLGIDFQIKTWKPKVNFNPHLTLTWNRLVKRFLT